MKKAYHKLSLKVHPDRVPESEKEEATEKFKVLGKIHSILSCKEKRSIYDETGCIDEEDHVFGDFDWMSYWKAVFKPISEKDINDYEKKYKNSSEEAMDLKKAYLNGKGDMDFILESVPFTNCDEEPRLREIINRFIEDGEVPEFELFKNEPPKKAARRKRKVIKNYIFFSFLTFFHHLSLPTTCIKTHTRDISISIEINFPWFFIFHRNIRQS